MTSTAIAPRHSLRDSLRSVGAIPGWDLSR